jgi:hypothetical protein
LDSCFCVQISASKWRFFTILRFCCLVGMLMYVVSPIATSMFSSLFGLCRSRRVVSKAHRRERIAGHRELGAMWGFP